MSVTSGFDARCQSLAFCCPRLKCAKLLSHFVQAFVRALWCCLQDKLLLSRSVHARATFQGIHSKPVCCSQPRRCILFPRADAIERLLTNNDELQQERAQLQRRAKQFKGFSRQELENQEVMADAAMRASSWVSRRWEIRCRLLW